MGERKGQNKYYPPDYDPRKGSLNAFLGTHALRDRAKKIDQGILIIRFEMPYSIWCEGCGIHIGMGVRYNAEKKKVGNYYTTPIYQFRMKCDLCDQYFEIKTDPKNFDYEIVSGCRRQERRWAPDEGEMVEPTGKEEAGKLATDSMYKLEHGTADAQKQKSVAPVIEKLQQFQERRRDDYAANQLLRAEFRKKRKKLKEEEAVDREICKRSGLNLSLLPETDADRKTASLIAQYRTRSSLQESAADKRAKIEARPIFQRRKTYSTISSPLSSQKAILKSVLVGKKKQTPKDTTVLPREVNIRERLKNNLAGEPPKPTDAICSQGGLSLLSSYGGSDSE